MRYDPAEVLAKLQANGAAIESDTPLTVKIINSRLHKDSIPSPKKEETTDYTPVICGKGRPLKWIPNKYIRTVTNFVGYLADTSKRSFQITMKNKVTGEVFVSTKPYVHRWTEIYRRGLLAKFYQLERYLGQNLSNIIMISLTCSTRGKSYEALLSEIRIGRKKILDDLRWKYGTRDYFWFIEPHKSGFAHLHVAYFHTIPLSDQVWLKHLWAEKYGYGSFDNGVNFLAPRASSDGSVPSGIVGNIRKYLTKYVAKGVHPNSEKFEISLHGRSFSLNMSPAELLFNALLKQTKTRLWSCSRNFSRIMKRPEKEKNPDLECIEVDQFYGTSLADECEFYPDETPVETHKRLYSVIWTRDGGLRPAIVKTWRYLMRVPTWCFTGSWTEKERIKDGCKFEMDGEFTKIFEPVWRSVDDL